MREVYPVCILVPYPPIMTVYPVYRSCRLCLRRTTHGHCQGEHIRGTLGIMLFVRALPRSAPQVALLLRHVPSAVPVAV